ncbi:MAG: hypothetical protein HYX88_03460 [Chloroflexi bacterium]|nr:hypothetical protein [Chloroflexota bacterium]
MIEAKKADHWAETLLSSPLSFWQVVKKMGERRTGKSALPAASDSDFLALSKPYIIAATPEGIENALEVYHRHRRP